MASDEFDELDGMSRDELVAKARALGAKRPEVMTRVELRDEIIRLSEPDTAAQRKSRGWLGVARDLVASVVESGLNMRDAAAAIRGEQRSDQEWLGPPPVATVTLAEIYVAQGHPERALGILDEVLAREPDHPAANQLRERLVNERSGKERRRARVEVAPRVVELEPVPLAPAESAEPIESPGPLTPRVTVTLSPPELTPLSPTVVLSSPTLPSSPDEEVPPSDVVLVSELGPSSQVPISEAAPVSEVVPSSESPFSTMNPERTILDYAVEEPVQRRECVLVRDGAKWLAYWDVKPLPGPLVLRVAAFVPRSPRPERIEREIKLDGAEGGCKVDGIPQQAVVRGVLGYGTGASFQALVVAVILEGNEGAAKRSVYRPPGQPPSELEQELATPTI